MPRVVKHLCHSTEEKHEPCLVEIFRFYIGLGESPAKEVTAFYFKPSKTKFEFDKVPVGQGLEGYFRDSGFDQNTVRESEKR